MAHNFFGLKFGTKTLKSEGETRVLPPRKTLMNIPPAEDILHFSYPPESRFYSPAPEET